jgi:hypothetical protein
MLWGMPRSGWLALVLVHAASAAAILACSTQSAPASSSSGNGEQTGKTDAPQPQQPEEPFTRCTDDDDCRLSCIQPNDCCGESTVHRCNQARHWDDHAKIAETRTRSKCADFDYSKCPITDFSVPDWVCLPVCKRGRCEAKKVEREQPPAPIDVSGYDRSCKTDANCIVVHTQPCAKCGCGNDPMAVRELKRFQEAMAAVKCPPYDLWPDIDCGDCRDAIAWCDAGECKGK